LKAQKFLHRIDPDDAKCVFTLTRTLLVTSAELLTYGKAAVRHPAWRHRLLAENAVPRRNDPCDLRAAGLHRPAGRTGATAAPEPHSLPREFAPNSPWRARITLACRGRGAGLAPAREEDRTPAEQLAAQPIRVGPWRGLRLVSACSLGQKHSIMAKPHLPKPSQAKPSQAKPEPLANTPSRLC